MGKASRKKKVTGPQTEEVEPLAPATGDRRLATPLSIGLALLVLIVFAQVVTHDYINWDDPAYASDNAVVQRGLTIDGIRYAFTTIEPYYWEPLTWLSLEVQSSLFGSRPAVFLIGNVVLHAAAVVLLFLLLDRTTGATWHAAFAAAIWGVHPLRVESVAWVAERKDVLSTMLFIATILAYVNGKRVWTFILFVLAVMAKPMVITLPVVLLLIDVWPLRRRPTIVDKIPLAIVAAIVAPITLIGQRGAISNLPPSLRLSNAVVSYVAYLGKTFVPIHLSILYPYDFNIPAWKVTACAVALIAITAAVLYWRKPWVTVGWFWYLVTLLPVIGIVQSGTQSMADRFTYIPAIGIVVAIVWSVPIAALGIAVVVACCAVTIFNLAYWRDSITLFDHAIAVTQDNALAYAKLGDGLLSANRLNEANEAYAKAVALSHGGSLPLAGQGITFVQQKRYTEALDPLRRSVAINPDLEPAQENYGTALMNSGHATEAIAAFEAALRLDKGSRRAEILQNLGDAKRSAGRGDGIAELRESIDLKPSAAAWSDLGSAYSAKNDVAHAEPAFIRALRLDPKLYDAHMNYAALLSRIGRNDDAAAHIREAMRIDPKSVEPHIYLALVDAASGKKAQAATLAIDAQQIDARAANDIFTRALHLAPKDTNLQEFIETMRR